MRIARASVLFATGMLVLTGLLASPASAQRTTFTGQFQCDDRGVVSPLGGMNVELWKRGDTFWPVEWVGRRKDRGYTANDGTFRLRSAEDEDNYFVRMALRDEHGVHLRDFWGINDWSVDTGRRRNNVATRNYGGIVFSKSGKSHKCALWSAVHKAYEEFRTETGTTLPSRGVEIEADAVTGGVPFTPGTSMLWPGDYPVGDSAGDESTARHEFGHVIRHGLDGDFGHFVGDAATFNYARNHSACGRTNNGFAFNEGWAEFWAQDYWPAPDCGRPGDMAVEGNVAAALTELMENCAANQRKYMVQTLRNNPQRIHSYAEFAAAMGCPFPKPEPVTVLGLSAPPPPALPSSPAVRAARAQGDLRATTRQIRRLRKSLKGAVKRAKNAPDCKNAPCKDVLRRVTQPAVLKFELQMAKFQRAAVAPYNTKKEQIKLGQDDQSIGGLLKGTAKRERKLRRKIVRASLARVNEAMKAARPILRTNSSKPIKHLYGDLNKAAKLFRRAKGKKGAKALPGPLVMAPASFKLPKRKAKRIPEPAPVPLPSPILDQRAFSQLTIGQCEPSVKGEKPIPVAGKLLPAVQGTPVTVTYSHPNGGVVQKVAATDAAGNWSVAYEPSLNFPGVWTAIATFAGDGTRHASTSTACQTQFQ